MDQAALMRVIAGLSAQVSMLTAKQFAHDRALDAIMIALGTKDSWLPKQVSSTLDQVAEGLIDLVPEDLRDDYRESIASIRERLARMA